MAHRPDAIASDAAAALHPEAIVIPSPAELRTQRYADATHRPLHGLIFTLPLVVIYSVAVAAVELGYFHASSVVLAYQMMLQGFATLGAQWLFLPALSVPAIFVFWHVTTREAWVVRPGVVAGMWIESLLLTLPLFALAILVPQLITLTAGLHPPTLAVCSREAFAATLALGIGAGIYEELIFRLVAMAVFCVILTDLCKLPVGVGVAVGIVMSGLLFSLYHHLGGAPMDPATFHFRWAAGVLLGVIFVTRGLAVAVGTHALYDLLAVTIVAMQGGDAITVA